MRGIIILLCALLSLHGCFGGGQGESISITPSSVHLAVGQTQQFTLTRTFYGRSEEDTATEFSNSNSNVATDLEDSAELSVTALAPGLSEQTVFVDGLSATATINVRRHWTTTEIAVPSLVQASANLAVDIPESAASIGIALMGTNSNLKMTDHGIFLVDGFGNPVFIVDPSGSPISLSFKYTDIDLDGINDRASFSMLFAREITSLFFPNNGSVGTLSSGTYTFPIASWNSSGTGLEADTLQPYVYYKTQVSQRTAMNLNIFVVSGINGISSATEAAADVEIAGALEQLRNVFERDPDSAITLQINVDVVSDSSFAILETRSEWNTLNRSYPNTKTHDAMNIFIVSVIDFGSGRAIGLAPRVPGPFNRQGTINSGTLAEYQGDSEGATLGIVLAHEFGHFLGLYHTSQTNEAKTGIVGFDPIDDTPVCTDADILAADSLTGCPDVTNFMFPTAFDTATDISDQQGIVLRLNPVVSVP